MRVTKTWAWYSDDKWPNFNQRDADNGDRVGEKNVTLDGRSSYTEIEWIDGNHDGMINDDDRDDHTRAGHDGVFVDGQFRTVHEAVSYSKSTVMVNGKPMTVPVDAFIFKDGTYMLRMRDEDMPKGVGPDAIGKVDLGRWDGREYDMSHVWTRDDPFMCFAAETLIDTPDGPRAAGSLVAGDLVLTLDRGPQPIRWAGMRRVRGQGAMAPVRIAAGALGNDAALRVSQQHRMLVTGWKAELLTGEAEVLVAAVHLVDGASIALEPCEAVSYVHLLFDSHEVVRAHGAWSESFHPGVQAEAMLDDAQCEEIFAIFPELRLGFGAYGATARPCLRAWEARALAA